MKIGNRIKASAMQFAILVSVIVALLLSSFLLYTYTYSRFSLQSDLVLQNIKGSNLGISYLCRENIIVQDSLNIILEETPVRLQKETRGGFELGRSRAGIGSSSFEKVALLGSPAGEGNPALFLEDHHLPLVLVGEARIKGDAYTPEDIIKPGSIAGHYYTGRQMVDGRRFYSSESLPPLEAQWKSSCKQLLDFVPDRDEQVIELQDASNSFMSPQQLIYNTEEIIVAWESLTGNIILRSETAVEIGAFARLDQVLIIAPKVIFRNGFKGSAHVVAEEVMVEENVRLEYPSSIVVFEKEQREAEVDYASKTKIHLGRNSYFGGNVTFFRAAGEEKPRQDVVVEEGVVVEGSLYSEGYTELKGTVRGSLYTSFFVASHGGSLYINHIYNGVIEPGDRGADVSGLLLADRKKNPAAWMY